MRYFLLPAARSRGHEVHMTRGTSSAQIHAGRYEHGDRKYFAQITAKNGIAYSLTNELRKAILLGRCSVERACIEELAGANMRDVPSVW